MGLEYHNYEDAGMRLANSVCFWDGHPYYVTQVEGSTRNSTKVRLWPFNRVSSGTTKDTMVVDYTDDRFDYTPKQLGFLNYDGNCYFLTRIPARIQKQGLVSEQVTCTSSPRFYIGDVFTSNAFESMLLGNYPTLDNCLKKLSENPYTVGMAFSRNFCVRSEKKLLFIYFRETPVMISTSRSGPSNFQELPDIPGINLIKRIMKNEGVYNQCYK